MLTTDQALDRAVDLAAQARPRAILGLTGPPGAGKSTYASWLVDALTARGVAAVLVPMDGFHLAQSALDRLGLAAVKGAPQTFDAGGYVALLARLRLAPSREEVVWAPAFDRDLEDAIAASIEVPPAVRVVVTEGNYLLYGEGLWATVRPLLDECWYVDLPDDERRIRLQARHERHGRTPESARERTWGSDEANAILVTSTRDRADALIVGPAGLSPLDR